MALYQPKTRRNVINCFIFPTNSYYHDKGTCSTDVRMWSYFSLPFLLCLCFHLLAISAESSNNRGRCTYDFQVWQPNEEMLERVNSVEVKFSNFSNYVDKELLKLRYDSSKDFHRYFNWTTSLERSLMQLKINQIEKLSDKIAMKEELRRFYDKITKVDSKVDDFILHYADQKPRNIRRKHVRKDRTLANHAPQADRPDSYLVSVLKNMVSDLKSEWILMKRDLFDIRTKSIEIQAEQGQINNKTFDLLSAVDQLQDKWLTVKNTGLKNSNAINNFKSDVESLKHDFYYIKGLQEQVRDDVLSGKNDANALRAKLISTQKALEELLNQNAVLQNDIDSLKRDEVTIFRPQVAATTVVDMDPFDIPGGK